MERFIFVGGTPRCGKSTLARRLAAVSDGQMLDLETHRDSLLPVVSPRDRKILTLAPKVTECTAAEWNDILFRRDTLQWRAIKAMAQCSINIRKGFIYEGTMYPKHVDEMDGVESVFMVDTDPDQADRLIAIAHDPDASNNWMRQRNYDDDKIRLWAGHNLFRNILMREQAEACGLPVFDVAEGGVAVKQQEAYDYLMAA